jgi:hypothetical protein
MAKKKYTDSLHGAFAQFITPTEPAPQGEAVKTEDNGGTEGETITDTADNGKTHGAKLPPEEVKQRKERATRNAKYKNAPVAMYRAKPDHSAPRTRKVHMLLRPQMFAELLAIAHSRGQSFTGLIEEIAGKFLEERKK